MKKNKSHEILERKNTAKFTSSCGGCGVALGSLLNLSGVLLLIFKAFHNSCLCVGKALIGGWVPMRRRAIYQQFSLISGISSSVPGYVYAVMSICAKR